MQVVFDHSDGLSERVRTFWFRPERRVRYVAGQFVELHLPQLPGEWREFTLSSSPHEPLLGITTKIYEQPSPFKQALSALLPGDMATITEPMGDFVLPKDTSIPLVFIAGGLGITPFASIAKQLLRDNDARDTQLFYAVRHEQDLILTDLFKPATTTTFVSLNSGTRLSAAEVLARTNAADNTLFYIAGPEQFVTDIRTDLLTKKIGSERIVTDSFTGYNSL